jgi:hypothetical protein
VSGHKVADNSGILVVSANAESDIANVEDLACCEHFKLFFLGYRVVDDNTVGGYSLIEMLILGIATVVGVTLKNELLSTGSGRTVFAKTVVNAANHKGTRVNRGSGTLRPVCITVNGLLLERSENRACQIQDKLIVVDLAGKVNLEGVRIMSKDANVIDRAVAKLSFACICDVKKKASSFAVEACVKDSLPRIYNVLGGNNSTVRPAVVLLEVDHHGIFLGVVVFSDLVVINDGVNYLTVFIDGEKGVVDKTADLESRVVVVAKCGIKVEDLFAEIKGDLCALDDFTVDLLVIASGEKSEAADDAEK